LVSSSLAAAIAARTVHSMGLTDAQLLELVEEAIANRLAGSSYESYSDGALQFRATPMASLFDMRTRLQQSVRGTAFTLARINRSRR
jgi:hypothetical protein